MRGIRTTLVIGLPGTGKTRYTKKNLGEDSVAYDLDAIAAALRLTNPHTEENGVSRKIANELLCAFLQVAQCNANRVFVIRTAPLPDEIDMINPDEIVCLNIVLADRGLSSLRRFNLENQIDASIRYANKRGIRIINVN